MPQQEPIMPTTCDWCGQLFNTSRQHPSRYCSISCEEGRAPRAMEHPESPDYHLYLQGEPESLVGKALVACGLRLTSDGDVRKDDVYLGKVVDYDSWYTIEREDLETGEITTRRIKDVLVVDMILRDRWSVDG